MQNEIAFLLRALHEKNQSPSGIFDAPNIGVDSDCDISRQFCETFPHTTLALLLAHMGVSMGLIEVPHSGWYVLPTFYSEQFASDLTPEAAAEVIMKEMAGLTTKRMQIRSRAFAALGPHWVNRLYSMRLPELVQADTVGPTIAEVIAQNPKVVDQIRAGKTQALGFLVGQTLKRVKVDPATVKAKIEAALGLS